VILVITGSGIAQAYGLLSYPSPTEQFALAKYITKSSLSAVILVITGSGSTGLWTVKLPPVQPNSLYSQNI